MDIAKLESIAKERKWILILDDKPWRVYLTENNIPIAIKVNKKGIVQDIQISTTSGYEDGES
jgi:hypothetical protein